MKTWKDIAIGPHTSLIDTIRIIDRGSQQIALVVDEDQHLLGTVTDGDIRRGILRRLSLEDTVDTVMNCKPVVVCDTDSDETILDLIAKTALHHLPVVDSAGRVVGLRLLDELLARRQRHSNWVVLMAGGLGSRLRPLTNDVPKPLLRVGNRPILETILGQFREHGFSRFYISVNYMADQVKAYFGDGSAWDVEIRYLEEDRRLGTAGALSLIPERPTEPVIVMNGDLLTKANFRQLLAYHREQGTDATMAVREYEFQVPFGVVETTDNLLVAVVEKPVHSFLVNAGIYVLNPDLLGRVPLEKEFDMPAFFDLLGKQDRKVAVFPLREFWLDIGRADDLVRANHVFSDHFD